MSRKQGSPELSEDSDQSSNGSDAVFEKENDVKRAKLMSLSDTTLDDPPIEMPERVFAEAIVTCTEVMEMNLTKSTWKEQAALDHTVDETFRLEILHQSPLNAPDYLSEAFTFRDELLMLSREDFKEVYWINVYDRNNVAQVKDTIPLSGIKATGMAACAVSNCLYVLNVKTHDPVFVLRITKEAEHTFKVSPFIRGRWKPDGLCVAANGSLILWKKNRRKESTKVLVYDDAGSLQHRIKLSSDLYRVDKMIPKSNGHLVLVTTKDKSDLRTRLTEIDMRGNSVRHYQSSLIAYDAVSAAGPRDRIVIVEQLNQIELLDEEFNLLKVVCPTQLDNNIQDRLPTDFWMHSSVHYNSRRNELVSCFTDSSYLPVLYIYRFAKDSNL